MRVVFRSLESRATICAQSLWFGWALLGSGSVVEIGIDGFVVVCVV